MASEPSRGGSSDVKHLDIDGILDLLDVHETERAECVRLLTHSAGLDPAEVSRTAETFRSLIGKFPKSLPPVNSDVLVTLAANLLITPDAIAWQVEHHIDPAVTRLTFADFGRQLALVRRHTGGFGIADPRWPLAYMLGGLFQLGRLQFHLRQYDRIPNVVEASDWVLNVHIPATGPLDAGAVSDSIRAARDFFTDLFPDKPVRIAVCNSWLLDPYLIARLPESNIAAFARRFTMHSGPTDDPTAALHFVFGTEDLTVTDRLPKNTSLQRLILNRIEAGGTWQRACGHLTLD